MDSRVRQRGNVPTQERKTKLTDLKKIKQQGALVQGFSRFDTLPWYLLVLFVFLLALMCSLSIHFYWKLPDPVHHDDPNEFVVDNARKHLLDITNLGIRHVGSENNEVHAKRLLLKKLEDIRSSASDKVEFEISEQLVSGNYYLDFLGGMTHLYQNISNVVAKLYTKGTSPEHAFLINAHYDSALGTIAASDDAVSCSTMLEVLRCLSSDPHPLISEHALIFLFNGAEETILQASHGFITQHPWAKDVRAFLNLEAAGAGGREIVFQTGPNHPWLTRLYADSVPHPHASIVAQEIFQSGIIPSDTDFRVFRDHGHIPGIDTAYFVNGYVYHTEYDIPSAIPDGSIQRAGDNVVALLRAVSNSTVLGNPGEEDRYGKIVFFDVMGMMMVVFEEKVAIALNCSVAIGVLITIYIGSSISNNRKKKADTPTFGLILKAVGIIVLSLAISTITAVTVAVILIAIGRSMTWYAHPIMILPLYVVPCFLAVTGLHTYWINNNKDTISKLALERSCFYASQLLWVVFLVLFTSLRICSAVLLFTAVFFPLVFRSILLDLLIRNELKNSDQSMYGVAFVVSMAFSIGIPLMLGVQLIVGLVEMFIPLMGRSGGLLPPDLAVAVIVAFMVWFNLPHMMCVLVYTSSSQVKKVFGVLLLMLFTSGLILSASGYVPPYSVSDPMLPRAKRFFLQHTDRTFYNIDGMVKNTDSQIMINSFDYLGLKPIADVTPLFQDAKLLHCEGLYCSEPFYIPVKHLTKFAWYIPAPKLENLEPARLKVLSATKTSKTRMNFTFQAEFPNRCSMFIAPTKGHTMSSWSLETFVPPVTPCPGTYHDTGCYFVFYSRGVGDGNFTFWIEIEGAESVDGLIDIAVATHYLDPPKSMTQLIHKLMVALPDWVTAIGWTSKFSSWTF